MGKYGNEDGDRFVGMVGAYGRVLVPMMRRCHSRSLTPRARLESRRACISQSSELMEPMLRMVIVKRERVEGCAGLGGEVEVEECGLGWGGGTVKRGGRWGEVIRVGREG